MDASVVLPTRDRSGRLLETLAALERQSLERARFEVIVVDDGSAEPHRERLRGLTSPLRLRVVNRPHRGRAAARNAGARAAEGELLCFLDDDMLPAPDWLERHLAAHGGRAGPVAVLGAVPFRAEARREPLVQHLERIVQFEVCERPASRPSIRPLYGNASIPRRTFLDAGGYDESFEGYGGEDLELGFRLIQQGVPLIYEAGALAEHAYDKGFEQYCRDQESEGEAIVRLCAKHPAARAVWKIDVIEGPLLALAPGKRLLRLAWRLTRAAPWLLAPARAMIPRLERVPALRPLLFACYRAVSRTHYARGIERGLAGLPSAPRRVRVLQVTTFLHGSGGIEETIRVLCERLDPARYELAVCSIQDRPEQLSPEITRTGVRSYGLGRTGWFFDPVTTLALGQVIRAFDADIVHTHRNKPNWHGRLAAALPPRRAIVTTHHDMGDAAFARTASTRLRRPARRPAGECEERSSWTNGVLYPYLNVALNRLNDAVVSVSRAVRSVYTADPDDPRYPVVHAPYDERLFHGPAPAAPAGTVTLGCVGRLAWQKGHEVLLEAFRMLAPEHPELRLRIVGEGSLRPRLEAFLREHDLESVVELAGEQPHGTALHDGIDLYVQPSVSEGCSIAILEAMGRGIPVIASDVDGPRELVEAGRTGTLVPAEDPAALGEAIAGVLADWPRARAMAAAAQRRAESDFSTRAFLPRMERVYEDVLARRKRSAG